MAAIPFLIVTGILAGTMVLIDGKPKIEQVMVTGVALVICGATLVALA